MGEKQAVTDSVECRRQIRIEHPTAAGCVCGALEYPSADPSIGDAIF
jgi:hypothetical protein